MTQNSKIMPMTKEEAIVAFKELIRRYGIHWGASTPESAYDLQREICKVTTEADRHKALGQRA